MSLNKEVRLKTQDKNEGMKGEQSNNNILESIAVLLSYVLLVVLFPLAIFFCLTTVSEFERIVIFRLGRLRSNGAFGPGVIFYLPCVDFIFRVDLRTDSFDVPAQAVLTQDSVTIRVDAIVYYRINNPVKSVLTAMNPNRATELLAQTTLRNVAGETRLAELLASRDNLSREILRLMEEATFEWGVKVERVEIKEITMPRQLQRAMAAEQEATRQAKAKIAAADGELQSSTVLREASETMAKNPIALQLRYLQTLNTVSADKNHTIIVPFPLDILRKIFGESNKQKGGNNSTSDLEKQENQISEGQQNDETADLSTFLNKFKKPSVTDSDDSFYASTRRLSTM